MMMEETKAQRKEQPQHGAVPGRAVVSKGQFQSPECHDLSQVPKVT